MSKIFYYLWDHEWASFSSFPLLIFHFIAKSTDRTRFICFPQLLSSLSFFFFFSLRTQKHLRGSTTFSASKCHKTTTEMLVPSAESRFLFCLWTRTNVAQNGYMALQRLYTQSCSVNYRYLIAKLYAWASQKFLKQLLVQFILKQSIIYDYRVGCYALPR